MQTAETLAAADRDAEARYQADGFLVVPDTLLPADLVRRASQGMDALRRGEYDTGHPPCPSAWKPGDDPNRLCKIEQPQFANTAIRELVSHPALGQIAATITGATMVQAWWVQLLYKPPSSGNRGTDVPPEIWSSRRVGLLKGSDQHEGWAVYRRADRRHLTASRDRQQDGT